MKKRKNLAFIVTLLITVYSMLSTTSMVAGMNTDTTPKEQCVTLDYFEQTMSNAKHNPSSKAITCCGGSPNLAWKHKYIWHIYKEGGGPCLSLAYFGDQYCTKCGTIWQTNTCYKQTNTGCGQYHK